MRQAKFCPGDFETRISVAIGKEHCPAEVSLADVFVASVNDTPSWPRSESYCEYVAKIVGS